ATPTSLLTAADPGLGAQDRALLVRLERPQGTGVVERHLLTAGRGVRRPVLPVEPGAGARSVVIALLQRWLRTVDRPEGCDRWAGGVLETFEVTGSRCALELGIRARMGTGEIRVAGGVGAGKAQHHVEVEAAECGRQGALQDRPA